MPDRKRIAEYFLVVGLPPDDPQPLELSRMQEDEDDDDKHMNGSLRLEPITDITIVNVNECELPPRGFTVIKKTPEDHPADLNNDSFNSPAMYLCIKRGRDKPPLTEIGVFYYPKEGSPPPGHEVLRKTPYGRPANVSNSSIMEIYLTYKRASPTAGANCPVVTDVCVILGNKEESPPHAFIKIDKSLNRGILSSPVFVCYKSSRVRHHLLAYTGSILSRYPTTNYPECPLSESVPLFSLPTGAVLEAWPARNELPKPECSTFVLTDAEGVRLYGSSVSFYEPYDRSRLTEEQCDALELDLEVHRKLDLRVFSNKAIVIISLFPFFDAFKRFLHFLHARIHQVGSNENGALEVPLEKYVLHFLHEVPSPSPQVPNIELSLNDTTITLRMIEDTMNISQGGASFLYLLSDLGAENAISLLMYTLTEQKLLVHSLRQDRLTRVCEAIISIIFPLQWQCAYIPLCPLELSGLLHAPVPFIYGFDSQYFDFNRRPPEDVICVDLDAKLLHVPPDRKYVANKVLPKKPLKVLRTSLDERLQKIREFEQRRARNQAGSLALNRLENEIETSIKMFRDGTTPYPSSTVTGCTTTALSSFGDDLTIRPLRLANRHFSFNKEECFLRFMACLLRDYRHYLVPINPNASQISATDSFSLFDIEAFQRSKERSLHKFYSVVLRTQMFSRFIEENSLGSPGRDEMLAFFEGCTAIVDDSRDSPPLLERDKALVSEHTKLVLPPEGPDPDQRYEYHGFFPCLDEDLMRRLKPADNTALNETGCGDADSGITMSTGPGAPHNSSARDSVPPDDASPGHLESGPSTAAGTPRIGHRGSTISEGAAPPSQKPSWLRIKHEQMITNKIGRCTLNSKIRDKVWPYHLLSAAYCLWFPIVPAYLNFLANRRGSMSPQEQTAFPVELPMEQEYLLRYALGLVKRMVHLRVIPFDQVCYRVLLHMAACYRLPQLAMDVLAGMQYGGVQANAVTYALYNQVLLELGVVSDAMDNKSDSVSVHPSDKDSSFQSAMKRSMSDDGQLDSVRTPRMNSVAFGDDSDANRMTPEDGGYGTLKDGMDTAMTEIRHFMKEQSTRAMSSKSFEKELDSSKKEKSEEEVEVADSVAAPAPSPTDPLGVFETTATHEVPSEPQPTAVESTAAPPDEATSAETTETVQPPKPPEANVDVKKDTEETTKANDSPKTLPIIRRPKRPCIMRNRSLTSEDRRPNHVAKERIQEDSVEAGLLSSLTPTPGDDVDFNLPVSCRPSHATPPPPPIAESTPLAADVTVKPEASSDPDKTPMASISAQSDVATPTPQSAPVKLASPRRGPTRNLQSLWEEKSELHISFMASARIEKEKGVRRNSHGVTGSTYSVDSRISTETEEDLEEEEEVDDEEEDWSGLATFFQLARRAGLTSRLGGKGTPAAAQRSSTLSLPQGSTSAATVAAGSGMPEVDASSMTSRGSADNALSAMSNFKRNASIRMKDAASRFSQKMASMRQQLNNAVPSNVGGSSASQQGSGLNRSSGELMSNSIGNAAAVTGSWLSTSMRRLKASQDSSLGLGGGSIGEDSEDDDSESSETPGNICDIWKNLSGLGPSPTSSVPSSHRPSVTSTPTSPVEEGGQGFRQLQNSTPPALLILRLSSCSPCVQCRTLIYDEDIMNGWTYESSNLNTICPYCLNPTLPRLSISLTVDGEEKAMESHSCLYLSPLALRKVMETVFIGEGPDCLQQVGVIEGHPELFWNCLWYFTRLQLPNHLVHLVGWWWSQKTGRTQMCRVRVELKWDSWLVSGADAGMKPLYRTWADKINCSEDDPQFPIVKHMERILNCIKLSDMRTALDLFLDERRVKLTDRSAYREILYLSMQALGRKNIDIESFLHFYTEAHKAVIDRADSERMVQRCDKVPAKGATWCRMLFPVLEL